MNTITKTPAECAPEEIEAFVYMLAAAGTVDRGGLDTRVRAAEKLVFLIDGDEIGSDNVFGIGAIKRPVATYKARCFDGAGQDEYSDYDLELGWVVVDESQRNTGQGKQICAKLMEGITTPIFATTDADNAHMRKILDQNGFTILGNPYVGYVTGKQIILYVKR